MLGHGPTWRDLQGQRKPLAEIAGGCFFPVSLLRDRGLWRLRWVPGAGTSLERSRGQAWSQGSEVAERKRHSLGTRGHGLHLCTAGLEASLQSWTSLWDAASVMGIWLQPSYFSSTSPIILISALNKFKFVPGFPYLWKLFGFVYSLIKIKF